MSELHTLSSKLKFWNFFWQITYCAMDEDTWQKNRLDGKCSGAKIDKTKPKFPVDQTLTHLGHESLTWKCYSHQQRLLTNFLQKCQKQFHCLCIELYRYTNFWLNIRLCQILISTIINALKIKCTLIKNFLLFSVSAYDGENRFEKSIGNLNF